METNLLLYTLLSKSGSQGTKCEYSLSYGVTAGQFWAEGRNLYLALRGLTYSVINRTPYLTGNKAFPPLRTKRPRPKPEIGRAHV